MGEYLEEPTEMMMPDDKDDYVSPNKEAHLTSEFQTKLQEINEVDKEKEASKMTLELIDKIKTWMSLIKKNNGEMISMDIALKDISKSFPHNPIAELTVFSKGWNRDMFYGKTVLGGEIKKKILGSELTSTELIEFIPEIIENIDDKISSLEQEISAKQKGQERLQRVKNEDTLMAKLRKYIKGEKE